MQFFPTGKNGIFLMKECLDSCFLDMQNKMQYFSFYKDCSAKNILA